jgi:hypothetical protein
MAEQTKATETGTTQATEGAPAAGTTPEKLYTQSDLDAAVRKGLKTREEHLAAEKEKALKKAEMDAAVARGDFDKVKAELEAKARAAEVTAQALRVEHDLKIAALAAGIQDPDDIRLLPADVVASLTDEHGGVVKAAVAKAIDALKTSKGYLFKAQTAPPAPTPAFAGTASPGTAVPSMPQGEVTAEQILKNRVAMNEKQRNISAPSFADAMRDALTRRK